MTRPSVRALHPSWRDSLVLTTETGRARRHKTGACGSYALDGARLCVTWDDGGSDVFIRNTHGVFIHDSLPPVRINGIGDVRVGERLFGAAGVTVDVGGHLVTIRLHTSDVPTFAQVFAAREYDSPHLPAEARTIVDLGANVGFATVFFGQRYPAARILAVEPEDANFAALVGNTTGLGARVHRERAAVWIRDGDISLQTEDDNGPLGEWGVRTTEQPVSNGRSTPCYRLDTLLRKHGFDHVDILKIDIEGAELELLSDDATSWLSRVGLIIIETHDRFRPGSEAATRAALAPMFDEQTSKGENLFFRRRG